MSIYLSGGPKMTGEERAITDRVMKMTIGQVKAAATEVANRNDDESTLDFLLARLAHMTMSYEFISFCESLPEPGRNR